MGIKGLMKVLQECAPNSIKQQTMKSYFGRKIALDASMCLYQFIIAVRQEGQNLSSEDGEITSHLQGMFYRTLRMLDAGLKPVYVFDGKPPELKQQVELKKRADRRADTEAELKEAQEGGDQDEIDKLQRRLVRVTKEQNLEVQRLLTLMGVPWVAATGEAEATCAALCQQGLVYATGTEDMDALTFGTPKLVRNLTAAESRKLPILEIDLKKALEEMKMNQAEFIDFCILLGCDYSPSIRNIGPKTALELIQEHRSIEAAIPHINKERSPIPPDFNYTGAADLFVNPDVAPDFSHLKLELHKPDEQGLIDFLHGEKNFGETRVRNGIERLLAARAKMGQQRLENWFSVVKPTSDVLNPAKIAQEKRIAQEKAEKTKNAASKRKTPGQHPDAVKKSRR